MNEKTSEKIIQFVKSKGQVTAHELTDYLMISSRAVFKQLEKLYSQGNISKVGKPPRVFYFIPKPVPPFQGITLKKEILGVIEKNYLFIAPTGEMREGIEGFLYWCRRNNLDVNKTAGEYVKTLQKYQTFFQNNLIDGMQKMKDTFPDVYLDHLYYMDFYSIERFGKTKLGQLLLYAKQSQDKTLIKRLTFLIKPKVDFIIKKYKIDGIGFIPPTVKREIQLIKETEKELNLPVRKVSITKIRTEIIVPQKTLSKLKDRIENARKTFVVNETKNFTNILLLDDAVGSGATLNEIAAKIRAKRICRGKIIGLAITGSFKGFDVISEV